MHYHFLIILSLVVSLKTYDYDYICGDGDDMPSACEPDGSGYTMYYCPYEGPYEKIESTACPIDKSCKCFKDSRNYDEKRCECVSSRKRPEFPLTGILRWNGTYSWGISWDDYDDYYDEPWQRFIPGEAHKDKHGRFLLKKMVPDNMGMNNNQPNKMVEVFEIILPQHGNGKFTKYTGKTGSKQCKTEEVEEEGKLNSIWKDDPRRYYHLIEETPKTKNTDEQVWVQQITGSYLYEYWKLTLEFNKRKRYAIPVEFEYDYQDIMGAQRTQAMVSFTYEPIMGEDESFRLKDYCSNV